LGRRSKVSRVYVDRLIISPHYPPFKGGQSQIQFLPHVLLVELRWKHRDRAVLLAPTVLEELVRFPR